MTRAGSPARSPIAQGGRARVPGALGRRFHRSPRLAGSGTAALLQHNQRVIRNDSVAMGIVNSATPFLPVLLVRLGGSSLQVSMLTAIPALAACVFAIPIGRWLQRRASIVGLYSRFRLAGQAAFAIMALATLLLPAPQAVVAMLAIWALAAVPSTAGLVAFPIVMDGAAGPRGRYELLSMRWAWMGLTTAVVVALAGQFLGQIAFPTNYQLLFAVFTIGGLASFWWCRQIRIPDQPALPVSREAARRDRLRAFVDEVRVERPFLGFELRSAVFNLGVGMAAPLLPLWYVNEAAAPDAWIGTIAMAQSLGSLFGYWMWRRVSRTRGPRWVLLPAMLAYGLMPIALSHVRLLPVIVTIAAVTGVAGAGTTLALFDGMLARIPKQLGVTFASIDQSVQNTALMVAPLIAGIVATQAGTAVALTLAGSLVLGGFALFLIVPPPRATAAELARRRAEAVASPAVVSAVEAAAPAGVLSADTAQAVEPRRIPEPATGPVPAAEHATAARPG